MKPACIFFVVFLVFIASCRGKSTGVSEIARDTTITKLNAFSDLFLDSAKLESFISRLQPGAEAAGQLRKFYNSRNFHFAWFTKDGLAEHARTFWNLQQSHVTLSKDSSLRDSILSKQVDDLVRRDSVTQSAAELNDLELQLTLHFFKYVRNVYAGRIDPEDISWHIPRKKINEMDLLDSLIANKGQNLESWEPINPQYRLMEAKLHDYHEMGKAGNWDIISLPAKKTYQQGDTSNTITQIKKRLIVLRDYSSVDTTPDFNSNLVAAVKQAQKRYGLKEHGIINATLIKALNISPNERIKQMLINMERMRWFPQQAPGKFILANIPEYKLHVFEDGKKVFDIDIIVGKEANRTIIFNGMLKFVVFSPYWNVPPSIVRNEILPAIRKNPDYLRANNMEQTGYVDGLPEIRQRPGSDNALGKVKFIFPNNYNIYFHDTPAKTLFKQEKRAFSHGCVRLAEPEKLARYLLRNQPQWTNEKIAEALKARKENWVVIKEPVPVAVTYFTAWVSRDGLLNFREDIYGHDQKMGALLFAPGQR